jgi:3'-5' exoribonuclease
MLKKRQFVKKLEEYDKVDDLFLVLAKQLGVGRNKQSFLRLTVGDASGSIETRLWEGAEECAKQFKQGDLVYIQGKVTTFKNVKQINTDRISPFDDLAKVDWGDFFPVAERPAEDMWAELSGLLDLIGHPHIKRLVSAFTTDDAFMAKFKRSPAATGMHHAYISGLLEHTLGVVKLARAVALLYPLDGDLLLAGAFLHDIGKTEELQAAAGFDYTDEGRLIGHLVMGLTMVREKCSKLEGFPRELQTHVEHLMLSHHGELEWGSPKRPKTLEALALHAIDNIDAKLAAATKAINEAEEGDENWTGYLRMFERPLTRTPNFRKAEYAADVFFGIKDTAPAAAICEKVESEEETEDVSAIESLVAVEEPEEAMEEGQNPADHSADPAACDCAATENCEAAEEKPSRSEPPAPESGKLALRVGQGKLGI